MSCPIESPGIWVAGRCSLALEQTGLVDGLFLKDSCKQVRQVSMTNILGRIGPILKQRDGADGF